MFAPLSRADWQRIAMHKAEGHAWLFIAQQTRLPLELIEQLPWTHPEAWAQTLATAEQIVARDTMTEMLLLLRGDLVKATGTERATIVNTITRLLKLQWQSTTGVADLTSPMQPPCPPCSEAERGEPASDTSDDVADASTNSLLAASEQGGQGGEVCILPPLPPLSPLTVPAPTTPMTAARLKAILNTLTMLFVLGGTLLGFVGCALARRPEAAEVRVAKANVCPEERGPNVAVAAGPMPWPPAAQGEASCHSRAPTVRGNRDRGL